MNRLLEDFGEPKKNRRPARATANEAALKREMPVGKVSSQHGGKYLRPHIWEASDQSRMRNATPFGVAFLRWGFFCRVWSPLSANAGWVAGEAVGFAC